MFPVVKARVSVQFDPGPEPPERLQLLSIDRGVVQALIVRRCPFVLREWQLETNEAEFLEDGGLHVEREGLGGSLGVQILIPNQLRVKPRIGEFSSCEGERPEPARVIGGIRPVDRNWFSGGVLIRGLVCGYRI